MAVPYINIHTHRMPETCDEIDAEHSVIAVVNHDFSDEIDDNVPGVLYSVGIHPWNSLNAAADPDFIDEGISAMRAKLSMDSIVFVGEAGFDALRGASADIQRRLFVEQVRLSEEMHRPLVIHCVKMIDELMDIRRQMKPRQLWLMHGFRGKQEQAKQLMQHGIQLSFGPRFNEGSMQVAWKAQKMWLETDYTDCTIEEVYAMASECLQVSVEEIKKRIYQQAQTFALL